MNRQAPALPVRQRQRLNHRFQDDLDAGIMIWKRILFIMSSFCLAHLWSKRNDAVFRGVRTTAQHSVSRFWTLGIRHLSALARREHRGPNTVVAGALLHAGLDLFTLVPRDDLVYAGSGHDKLPDTDLLSWLRSFQTSCA